VTAKGKSGAMQRVEP